MENSEHPDDNNINKIKNIMAMINVDNSIINYLN